MASKEAPPEVAEKARETVLRGIEAANKEKMRRAAARKEHYLQCLSNANPLDYTINAVAKQAGIGVYAVSRWRKNAEFKRREDAIRANLAKVKKSVVGAAAADRMDITKHLTVGGLTELQVRWLRAYWQDKTEIGACQASGTMRPQYKRWQREDQSFAVALREIEEIHADELKGVLLRSGLQGDKSSAKEVLKAMGYTADAEPEVTGTHQQEADAALGRLMNGSS